VAAVLMVWTGFGAARLALADRDRATRPIRVAILQGNIPPYMKYDRKQSGELAHRYLELGAQAARHRPDLIVWSEAAIPWAFEEDDDLGGAMLEATRETQACHVLGAVSHAPGTAGLHHNSAFLMMPDGRVTDRYDKIGLVPFTERAVRIPGANPSGRLHPSTRGLVPGKTLRPMRTPFGKVGVSICNESFYGTWTRTTVRKGAKLLVNLGNDVWIQSDVVLRQHFAANILRAVESGRDMVVANNPGVSGIIDCWGRTQVTSEIREAGCWAGTVSMRAGRTVYTRIGDLLVLVCLGMAVGLPWMRGGNGR
jgi:apolipoprotein N-acyltransferase